MKNLSKYKNRLRAFGNPNISFKNKRKLLIQRGGFIVPLLTSILSGVIGAIINNNSTWKNSLQRMILVLPELWENRSQAPQPPPPVKKILKCKDHSGRKFVCIRTLI